MAQLNIYLLERPTKEEPRPEPKKLESCTVAADGDKAKKAARVMLEESGYDIRTMSWGPDTDPSKPHVLHAYVMKKEQA